MFELGISLIEYLLKFLEKRDENLDEFYERYVDPTYRTAESVFSDYLNMFQTVRDKIEQNDPIEEIIDYLEHSRNKYLPVRMMLRSEVFRRAFDRRYFDNREVFTDEALYEKLQLFEKGILGIMMGGLAPLEDMEEHQHSPYILGRHTLLNLLYRFNGYVSQGDSRERYLEAVDWQINALKLAWEDVVNGYAEYKVLVTPTPSTLKKRKNK